MQTGQHFRHNGLDGAAERVTVHALPLGDYTAEGAFYAKVDGKRVGERGRAFWKTEAAAMACGRRFLMQVPVPTL